jgi:hypothetical protein
MSSFSSSDQPPQPHPSPFPPSFSSSFCSATKFGSTMLVTALSITIGLSLAHAVSRPLRHKKIWRVVSGASGTCAHRLHFSLAARRSYTHTHTHITPRPASHAHEFTNPSRPTDPFTCRRHPLFAFTETSSCWYTTLLVKLCLTTPLYVPPVACTETSFRWFMTPVVKLGSIAESVSRTVTTMTKDMKVRT